MSDMKRPEIDNILLMVMERVSKILRSANESYTFYKETGEYSNLVQFTVLNKNGGVKSVYTFFVTDSASSNEDTRKIYKLMMYAISENVKRKKYTYYIANRHATISNKKELVIGPEKSRVWYYVDMALHEWYGYGSVVL